MCRHEVTIQDAVVAIIMVESSMSSSSVIGLESTLHSDFCENPDHVYQQQEKIVLTKLGFIADVSSPFDEPVEKRRRRH